MGASKEYLEFIARCEMSLGFGIVAISLLSVFVTYGLFGRKVENSFRSKFFYWLKSTILLAVLLFFWFGHKEPGGFSWLGVLMSFGLSGLFNLCRSQIGAGL
ncbi:hypothetical protein [Herbaspirillum sp. alder98]|uniref:hypothetical protein n=1 Tax=Herbaspirillum sp. alder98 TaxID=2913096 RepID=UPI001CD872E3|nr:hypothetical protein [Herbaspirillum sp. alder98]MCA1323683.1 hypothetical protein [Herbaspirillum sp. alder98]